VKALLVLLGVLFIIAHPAAVAAVVVSHPVLILLAELAVLAVIAAGIARAAGFSLDSLPWRAT
jgi:hypothetical protein